MPYNSKSFLSNESKAEFKMQVHLIKLYLKGRDWLNSHADCQRKFEGKNFVFPLLAECYVLWSIE